MLNQRPHGNVPPSAEPKSEKPALLDNGAHVKYASDHPDNAAAKAVHAEIAEKKKDAGPDPELTLGAP